MMKHEIFEKNSLHPVGRHPVGGLELAASSRSHRCSGSRARSRRWRACGPTPRSNWPAATSTSARAATTATAQMVRTLRDEVERYGHYSLAAESMYDHPFQWGSKRTGPDLARVGGKYSNQWHVEHMINPRAVVPESIMPGYPWLAERTLDVDNIAEKLKTQVAVGVPYTEEMIEKAKQDLLAQIDPDSDGAEDLVAALSEGCCRQVRRQARQPADRARCDDRLSADAWNARRLRELRCIRPEPALRRTSDV